MCGMLHVHVHTCTVTRDTQTCMKKKSFFSTQISYIIKYICILAVPKV